MLCARLQLVKFSDWTIYSRGRILRWSFTSWNSLNKSIAYINCFKSLTNNKQIQWSSVVWTVKTLRISVWLHPVADRYSARVGPTSCGGARHSQLGANLVSQQAYLTFIFPLKGGPKSIAKLDGGMAGFAPLDLPMITIELSLCLRAGLLAKRAGIQQLSLLNWSLLRQSPQTMQSFQTHLYSVSEYKLYPTQWQSGWVGQYQQVSAFEQTPFPLFSDVLYRQPPMDGWALVDRNWKVMNWI